MQTPKYFLNQYELKRILQQSKRLAQLNQVLTPCLPKQCVGHVQVASATPPLLVLQTANANLATELRFRATEILERIRFLTEYSHFTQLKITVAPDSATKPNHPNPPTKINQSSAEIIASMAETIHHPALKAALTQLAAKAINKGKS